MSSAPQNTLQRALAGLPRPSFSAGLLFLLCTWLCAVLVFNLPGHLTTDSLIQIAEGRSGRIESWNPPFSSWIFGSLVSWGGGTELIVVLQTGMLMVAILAWLHNRSQGSRWAWPVLAVLLCSPILLTYPGIVWKDVWFAHCALLAFGLVMLRHQGSGWWTEALALPLLASAMLSRQTGIVVCLAAVIAMAFAAHPRAPLRTVFVATAVRMLVLLIAASAWSSAVKARMQVQGDAVGTGVRLVALFDIAGMLQRQPDASLTVLNRHGFETKGWEDAARKTFSAERIDALEQPPITGPRSLDSGLLLQQWGHLVLQSPLTYLSHRWETFAWFSGLRTQARCLPIHVGIEPASLTAAAGVRPTPSAWSGWLYGYSRAWVETPYFAPFAWSVVSLILVALAAWRRDWRDPSLWLQLAALAYTGSFAVAGLSCDLRYSYFSIAAAILGLMRLAAYGHPLSRPQHA